MRLFVQGLILASAGAITYAIFTRSTVAMAGQAALKNDGGARLTGFAAPGATAPANVEYEAALLELIDEARRRGEHFIDVNAGDLDRKVDGAPGSKLRIATCCGVMRDSLHIGDLVLVKPRSGVGRSLTHRYRLVEKPPFRDF